MFTCPICNSEYPTDDFICQCGFKQFHKSTHDYLFEIYKFSKNIFNNVIDFQCSMLDSVKTKDNVLIYEVLEPKLSVAKVESNGNYSVCVKGILPWNLNVKSLIINVDEVDYKLLEESNVRMLFIGDKLTTINGGTIKPYSLLKYIEVDKKNTIYCSSNNVLFDKNMKKLVLYARGKSEEEYIIPSTVREVGQWAFYQCEHLKKIHASKKVHFDRDAIIPSTSVEVVYDLD